MKYIQKISIASLLILSTLPVLAFAANEAFPTGIGNNRFNGTAIQDPEVRNNEAFPTGSGDNGGYNRTALGTQREGAAPTVEKLEDKTLQQLVTDFILLLSGYVLKILLGLIILTFLYGLMKYMFKGQGSDTARTEGRKLMLWGIIGIFAVTSVWGLVAIFTNFVGHDSIVIPQFK